MTELIFLKVLTLKNIKKRQGNVVYGNFIILLTKILIIRCIYVMGVMICL